MDVLIVLLIRIRMDPLFPGSGIIVPDPGPAQMKEQINKNLISNFRPVNSGLCVQYCSWEILLFDWI